MSTSAPGPTKLGVAPNVGGLLCYAPCCIGLIFSVVAVIMEKENRFLRFHAFQGLIVQGGLLAACFVIWVLTFVLSTIAGALGLLGTLLQIVVGFGGLGLLIFLMMKAYNGEEYSLPTIGDQARKMM